MIKYDVRNLANGQVMGCLVLYNTRGDYLTEILTEKNQYYAPDAINDAIELSAMIKQACRQPHGKGTVMTRRDKLTKNGN